MPFPTTFLAAGWSDFSVGSWISVPAIVNRGVWYIYTHTPTLLRIAGGKYMTLGARPPHEERFFVVEVSGALARRRVVCL